MEKLKALKKFPNFRYDGSLYKKEGKFSSRKLIPKVKAVTIEDIAGAITESSGSVEIMFSNKEIITYEHKFSFGAFATIFSPGSKPEHINDLDKYMGSTGSVIGDLLLAYAEKRNLTIK